MVDIARAFVRSLIKPENGIGAVYSGGGGQLLVRWANGVQEWVDVESVKQVKAPKPPKPPREVVRAYVELSRLAKGWGKASPETKPQDEVIRESLSGDFSAVDRGSLLRIADASEEVAREMKLFRKEMREMMQFWKELRKECREQKRIDAEE